MAHTSNPKTHPEAKVSVASLAYTASEGVGGGGADNRKICSTGNFKISTIDKGNQRARNL